MTVLTEQARYRHEPSHWDYPAFQLLKDRIPNGSLLLDVGCGSGEVGGYLSAEDIIVHGVEPDPGRAEAARSNLAEVHIGTLETVSLDHVYDTVLLIDVLEHISDPAPTLRAARHALADGGRVICLVPNSAFWKFRLKVLRGDWRYHESGLFDRDHVRFYDSRTISDVPLSAGLVEVQRDYIAEHWTPTPVERVAVRRWPNLFAMHMLLEWQPG